MVKTHLFQNFDAAVDVDANHFIVLCKLWQLNPRFVTRNGGFGPGIPSKMPDHSGLGILQEFAEIEGIVYLS